MTALDQSQRYRDNVEEKAAGFPRVGSNGTGLKNRQVPWGSQSPSPKETRQLAASQKLFNAGVMDEQTKERIRKEISEHGERVRELDDMRKQDDREIEELNVHIAFIAADREKEMYAIHSLERLLDEPDRQRSWTAWNRNKREGDPLSVTYLMEQVLSNHPEGLKVPTLLAELRKLGFQTSSKNPIAILNSTLHRHKGDKFICLKDKRWCLLKDAPATFQNVIQIGGHSGKKTPVRSG